jgi:hypothetical protein
VQQLAVAPAEAPGTGALDLHKAISDPGAGGCPRWPESLRLLSSQGEIVRGRCRGTNRCLYCARLAAVENAEMLALDAMAGAAPTIWCVLTTRSGDPCPASFYESRRQVIKALQRRWPDLHYAALVEFTTGFGPRSGGVRRPHWNVLLKGLPATALDEAGAIIRRVWCAREDAEPAAQYVGTISEAGGLMRYIALHFQKCEQTPPEGWRGHRFLKSRGYFAGSTATAREEARRSLRFKRELWRALKAGHEGEAAEAVAAGAIERADATTWELRRVNLATGAPLDGTAQGALVPAARPVAARDDVRAGESRATAERALLRGLAAAVAVAPGGCSSTGQQLHLVNDVGEAASPDVAVVHLDLGGWQQPPPGSPPLPDAPVDVAVGTRPPDPSGARSASCEVSGDRLEHPGEPPAAAAIAHRPRAGHST